MTAGALRADGPVVARVPPEPVTDPADDVDVLDPPSRTVRFGGRDVLVRPMTVGKIPAVTRALRGVQLGDTSLEGIMVLVADHGDQVLQAAALATDLPLDEVKEAALPEFVELFGAVVEVNAAFFTRAVGALLGALGAWRGGGPTSSTASSTPDTAGLT